ncbi:hypothetical protein [Methanococcoides sp.]|uniref:hypothetical protein n=1 Tax=Methanococcoides sp. TaxID=1966350 RepID=UPI00272DC89C|nr:hypothetical protein [Methanococcoides sp.]
MSLRKFRDRSELLPFLFNSNYFSKYKIIKHSPNKEVWLIKVEGTLSDVDELWDALSNEVAARTAADENLQDQIPQFGEWNESSFNASEEQGCQFQIASLDKIHAENKDFTLFPGNDVEYNLLRKTLELNGNFAETIKKILILGDSKSNIRKYAG